MSYRNLLIPFEKWREVDAKFKVFALYILAIMLVYIIVLAYFSGNISMLLTLEMLTSIALLTFFHVHSVPLIMYIIYLNFVKALNQQHDVKSALVNTVSYATLAIVILYMYLAAAIALRFLIPY